MLTTSGGKGAERGHRRVSPAGRHAAVQDSPVSGEDRTPCTQNGNEHESGRKRSLNLKLRQNLDFREDKDRGKYLF